MKLTVYFILITFNARFHLCSFTVPHKCMYEQDLSEMIVNASGRQENNEKKIRKYRQRVDRATVFLNTMLQIRPLICRALCLYTHHNALKEEEEQVHFGIR